MPLLSPVSEALHAVISNPFCHQSHYSVLTALDKNELFISLGHQQLSLVPGVLISFLAPVCHGQGTTSLP